MSRGKALVALSGGVDSSVAAALLVEQGYAVEGVMLRLWAAPGDEGRADNRCCTVAAVERARQVAARLDIPFRLLDVGTLFRRAVVDYFIAEYGRGRTPNPCVVCNRAVRFQVLLAEVESAGAEFLATGHYARVRRVAGRYRLLRGRDRRKDQSYFLHRLTEAQLARVRFPLGEMTKAEVRETARRRGLPVAEQPESQDLCFLGAGDYRDFLTRYAPHLSRPGPIRDTAGRVLGEHRGLAGYTIGQRKGLGIAAREPLYVLAIEPEENALLVGTAAELGQTECRVEQMHYVAGEPPGDSFRAAAQIRYRARPVEVMVTTLTPDAVQVRFDAVQRDVTPGQFLVLYDDETVIGGGVICKARKL